MESFGQSNLSGDRLKFATLLLFSCALTSFAQDAPASSETPARPTTTIVLARTGERLDTPNVASIHYFEFLQVRNRWIYPDIGYIDFGHNNYREMFIGGGRTLIDSKFATWDQELLYDQATGPAAGSARYLQPWMMVRLRFTPKFTNETSYFVNLPLNDSARIEHILERAKLEYLLKKHWKIGAGYAGRKFADTAWQNKPFITTTLLTSAGAFEFWLQRVPNGAQVQFRYALFHKSH